MSYNPKEWKDRVVDRPRTYFFQSNPDGSTTLVPAPGTIHEPGTPANAPNFNHIEQGIADVDALVGGVGYERIIYGDNQRGTTLWNASANSITKSGPYYVIVHSGLPVAENGYITHISFTDTDDYALQIYTSAITDKQYYRRKTDGVWQPWIEIITSVGGQTINGTLDLKGNLRITKSNAGIGLNNTSSTHDAFLLNSTNSLHVQHYGDGTWKGNRFKLDLATGELYLGTTAAHQAWHTGQFRWNAAGYPEMLVGGTWIPIGDFPIGALRNLNRNVTAANGYTNTFTWYTIFETSFPGRIESLSARSDFTARMEYRVTIDGVPTVVGNVNEGGGDSAGRDYPYMAQGDTAIYFKQGLKIEARVSDTTTAAKNLITMGYRLLAGAP